MAARRGTGSRGRIRTLKREFFESPTVMSLPSFQTIVTFAGLICVQADDKGRLHDDADLIKAGVWSKRRDVTSDDVAEELPILSCHLRTANTSGLVVRYEKKGMKCIWISSFNEHQRISHPTQSKLPLPPAISRTFAKTPELFPPDVDLEVDVEKERDMDVDMTNELAGYVSEAQVFGTTLVRMTCRTSRAR